MTTAAPAAANTVAREARQLRWMRRSVDHYPWQQLGLAVAYAVVIGALNRRWWSGVPLAAVTFVLGAWMWQPGGVMRRALAARYLGFRPTGIRAPRSRAERVCLAITALWLVVTLVIAGFLADEWVHTETGCPTPDGWAYADARWTWSPPGLACDAVADLSGHVVPASSPSPWRWILVVLPVVGLGAVVVTARRWWREERTRPATSGRVGVSGDARVIAFFDARRRGSPFVDFGFPWLESERVAWRLRWICDTGELVGFRLVFPETSSPLGWVGGRDEPTVDAIAVLLVERSEDRVRQRLDGAEEQVRRPGGWDWVRDRVRSP